MLEVMCCDNCGVDSNENTPYDNPLPISLKDDTMLFRSHCGVCRNSSDDNVLTSTKNFCSYKCLHVFIKNNIPNTDIEPKKRLETMIQTELEHNLENRKTPNRMNTKQFLLKQLAKKILGVDVKWE